MKGEENPAAKLSEEEVYAIRRDARKHKLVAYDYGISQAHVWRIRNRVKWQSLPEEATDE